VLKDCLQILALIQSSILLGACSDGLGRSVEIIPSTSIIAGQKVWSTDGTLARTCFADFVVQLYYASNILFTIALGLSKISVVFFLIRLTVSRHQKLLFYIVAGLIAAWTVASAFTIALQCDVAHPWVIVDQECPGAVSVSGKFLR
jgi:hypothetical protein